MRKTFSRSENPHELNTKPKSIQHLFKKELKGSGLETNFLLKDTVLLLEKLMRKIYALTPNFTLQHLDFSTAANNLYGGPTCVVIKSNA